MAASRLVARIGRRTVCRSVFLFAAIVASAAVNADKWHFTDVDRIVAVGDVHGAYDAFVATLQAADVIDDDRAWSGGETHLVITGDLLDRGPGSRAAMDLVMRLESEAQAAGGRVHQLLGNHEVMNLIGDLRYVALEEYAAFEDIESKDDRAYWYRHFRASLSNDVNEDEASSVFENLAPPGFFGHRQAFRADGHYGRWLLSKPFTVVINETAFVHGGLPPLIAEQGLAGVNEGLNKDLLGYVATRSKLEDEAVVSPMLGFRELPALIDDGLASGNYTGPVAALMAAIVELSDSPLHRPQGPTWYRGTARCTPLVESDALETALTRIGAKRVVVGHTPTATRQIQQRMSGRVIEIDTGMLASHYDGFGHALIIDDRGVTSVNQAGRKIRSLLKRPIQVGISNRQVSERQMRRLLATGPISEVLAEGDGWKIVRIEVEHQSVTGYFRHNVDGAINVPEVAAYRLDRMIGLGMVPVTVRRELSGERGTLQLIPDNTITEQIRAQRPNNRSAHCNIDSQRRTMHAFDTLINNPTRSPLTMLYRDGDSRLILVNHSQAFGTDNGSEVLGNGTRPRLGEQWRKALSALDEDSLQASLKDVLDSEHLSALLERRNLLLLGNTL